MSNDNTVYADAQTWSDVKRIGGSILLTLLAAALLYGFTSGLVPFHAWLHRVAATIESPFQALGLTGLAVMATTQIALAARCAQVRRQLLSGQNPQHYVEDTGLFIHYAGLLVQFALTALAGLLIIKVPEDPGYADFAYVFGMLVLSLAFAYGSVFLSALIATRGDRFLPDNPILAWLLVIALPSVLFLGISLSKEAVCLWAAIMLLTYLLKPVGEGLQKLQHDMWRDQLNNQRIK